MTRLYKYLYNGRESQPHPNRDDPMKASNPYERYARTAKASRIALAIQSAHASAESTEPVHEVAARMTPTQRRLWALQAGVRVPSDATWAEVVRLLTPTVPMSDDEFKSVLSEFGR